MTIQTCDAPVAKAKDSDSEDEESAVKTKPSRKILEVGNTTYYHFKLPRGINSISDLDSHPDIDCWGIKWRKLGIYWKEGHETIIRCSDSSTDFKYPEGEKEDWEVWSDDNEDNDSKAGSDENMDELFQDHPFDIQKLLI